MLTSSHLRLTLIYLLYPHNMPSFVPPFMNLQHPHWVTLHLELLLSLLCYLCNIIVCKLSFLITPCLFIRILFGVIYPLSFYKIANFIRKKKIKHIFLSEFGLLSDLIHVFDFNSGLFIVTFACHYK